jgi:hypothetical protein
MASSLLSENDTVVVLQCRQPKGEEGPNNDWVKVSADDDETVLYGSPARKDGAKTEMDHLVKELIKCQRMLLNALTDLITNAMRLGRGERSTLVWRSVFATLNDSVMYGAVPTLPEDVMLDKNIDVDEDTNGSKNLLNLEAPTSDDDTLTQNMFCRLAAIVLTKAQ